MDAWIPLLQSLLWPAFIVGLILFYRPPLSSAFIALNERIKRGDAIKIFGLEFVARPLDKDETFKMSEGAIHNALVVELRNELSPEKLNTVEYNIVKHVRENSFLTIDSRPFDKNKGREWTVSYYQYRTVSALLDDIRTSIDAPNFSFGAPRKIFA
ncbi:MAG: hypothetical protein ACR2KT_12445 [Methylocella sp.]